MIGLTLSGGGSRAMAFHLGCLRALNDLGILDRIRVISTISGGSLIGAYFAYTPEKTFAEFDADVCKLLRKGLQLSVALELAKPWNFALSGASCMLSYFDALMSFLFRTQPVFTRHLSRTDMFSNVLTRSLFHKIKMSSPRRNIKAGRGIAMGSTKNQHH